MPPLSPEQKEDKNYILIEYEHPDTGSCEFDKQRIFMVSHVGQYPSLNFAHCPNSKCKVPLIDTGNWEPISNQEAQKYIREGRVSG